MITIRYFASIRDQLGHDQEQLPWHLNVASVHGLKQHLQNQYPCWQAISTKNTLLTAVNQHMANDTTPIEDGDEVAFFPPVTGG
jgi:molybdopterin synthase sulfur carrier subunit